jgi:hypothetical protein
MKTTRKAIRATPKKLSINTQAIEKREHVYDSDFFKWAKDQAKFLKRGEFSKLDIDNLIEEIESLGRSEKRTLESYLEKWLMHMLKVKFQSSKHTPSWDNTIEISIHKTRKTLFENPSLKPKLKEIVADAYFSARIMASTETGLAVATFPKECPWTLKEIFPDLEKKYC